MNRRLQRYGRQLAPATKLNDREVVSRNQYLEMQILRSSCETCCAFDQ